MTRSTSGRLGVFGVVALLGMIGLLPASAAQDPADPAIGDIVVDSYDCETGVLRFHVAVTDLPHIPDSNGPLGVSVIAHYAEGTDDGMPNSGFNPDPGDAPYTGDVPFSRGIALDAADSASPEDASGAIRSIDISAVLVTDPESGVIDSASTSHEVDCEAEDDDSTGSETSDQTTTLPGTGTGDLHAGRGSSGLAALLGGAALLLGAAALRLRRPV